MKLSLFTPTHRPDYLSETHTSLKLQTLTDWEWVILPNGSNAVIPETVKSDPRVRIVEGGNLHNIGALKRKACNALTGDVFIELDHDDLLVPGKSLEAIAAAFDKGAGFAYSDTAVFRFQQRAGVRTYNCYNYAAQHGWIDYPMFVYGRYLKATSCFDITPRSLSEIYYCPDHVRAWSRKAYYEAGGHNPELSVCDDHELMIKTYLTGAKFAHTGGCHYLYRLFDNNTVIMRNEKIRETSEKFRKEYLCRLVESWVSRNGLPTLDLTRLRLSGWTPEKHLLQGFGRNQFGHIIADTELQRLEGWQVREFMNEAYEGLVPGGYLTVTVPEVHSGMGYGDVEWKSHFSATSMSPYTRKQFARQNGKVNCRFQQINCVEVFPSDWHRDHGFKFLRFELVALKGQRHPGLQHI
jgi:glycosyltransferase involved in cell wall biosynthesis